MNNLKTFEDALFEAQEEKEKEKSSKDYKIGKVLSYSNDNKNKFIAGEDEFNIVDDTMEFGEVTANKAVNVDDKNYIIYVDKSGNLYTDMIDKVGLYKKILK